MSSAGSGLPDETNPHRGRGDLGQVLGAVPSSATVPVTLTLSPTATASAAEIQRCLGGGRVGIDVGILFLKVEAAERVRRLEVGRDNAPAASPTG